MKKLCLYTDLTDTQAQDKLESIFNNEIEFEDIMFIKSRKSFKLKSKQWDDPLMKFNRKKVFDFFKVEIHLNQNTKGTAIEIQLKTFSISFSTTFIFLSIIWGIGAYLFLHNQPIIFKLYSVIGILTSLFLFYKIYKSAKRQQIVVKKLTRAFSNN
ncbi:MAG: hypothetical protein HYR91_15285 [Flavobacteriia bacterium]|nr:hypothetical protein [Flavobacteriia bacterium]